MAAIHEYAAKLPENHRTAKLRRLFSGVFATIDGERDQIINGIRRYSRRQGSLAKRIEERSSELSHLPVSGDPDIAAQAAELEQQPIGIAASSMTANACCPISAISQWCLSSVCSR